VRKEEKKGRGEKRQDGGYKGATAARALLAEQEASWFEEEKTYGWWGSARLAKGRRHVFQDQSLARARWWVGRGERRRVGVVGEKQAQRTSDRWRKNGTGSAVS
jgi:hypothetical protein